MQIVPFKTAEKGLASCMQMHPAKAMETLQRIIAFADVARVFKDLRRPVPRVKIEISLSGKTDPEEVDNKILGALQKLFPVDDMMMESYHDAFTGESIFNDINNTVIIPEFVGWATSWDEIAEAVDDGPQYGPSMSVPIFLGAYMNEFDRDMWQIFADYFSWGVEYTKPKNGKVVDLAELYKLIDKSPEIKFDSSYIAAVLQDTGLACFDNNPYEEDSYDIEPFKWSYKNLMKLALEWKEAKKIIDLIPHNERVGRDPEQLKLLIQAIKACEVRRR